MFEIRQSLGVVKQNFFGWKRNPRILLTFLGALILCLLLSDEVLSHTQQYETSLQMLEPYIWTYGDAKSVLLSSLLLIVLFADMPFVNQATSYQLVRMKRRVWLIGQILYVILSIVIYNLFLLIIQIIFAAPFAYAGNVWSKTAAMLGYGSIENTMIPVSIKTMESTLPYKCTVQVFLLMFSYTLLITVIMLLMNLTVGKAWGVLCTFAINLYGVLLNPSIFQKIFDLKGNLEYRASLLCGWLSPLNHATFPMHNFGYDYLPSIYTSLIIFWGIIVVLIYFAAMKIEDYEFTFT